MASRELLKKFKAGGGNPSDKDAWKAFKKGGGGAAPSGPAAPAPPTPGQFLGNLPNPGDVYGDVLGNLDKFTTRNPDTNMAREWISGMLGGNMGANPWEQDLYDETRGVNPNDAFGWLWEYVGGKGGGAGGAGGGAAGGGRNVRYGYSPRDGVSIARSASSQGGGQVPDTVGPSNSFFAQKIKELFDPAVLDPANDPTMQPLLEAMRRENQENMLSSISDLTAQAENQGAYGSGLYQAMLGRAREEGMESLDASTAGLLQQAREGALQRRMGGLDMTNTRDIAAMQDLTDRYGIDASAAAAGAGASAAAADAAEGRKLQALNMLMGGQLDVLGLRGNMANMRQGGQLGAMQGAIGLGNMGLEAEGMRSGIAGNVLNNLLGYHQGENQYRLGQGQLDVSRRGLNIDRGRLNLQRDQWEDQVSQDSLNSLLDILMGVGGMGGSGELGGQYIPGGPPPWLAGLIGGFGGYTNKGGQ